MARPKRCYPLARSAPRAECGGAHFSIMAAGAGARQDLRWRTGGAARRVCLSFPTRPPCLGPLAAGGQYMLGDARSAAPRGTARVAPPRAPASHPAGRELSAMAPKKNPLNLNALQLRTLTLLQQLARLPDYSRPGEE